jgi:ATP-dependent DNA helicase RecG
MEFARKHLPDPFHLEKDQRISLRDTIFREIIANTLIHREYLNSFPAKFIIENDTVTIENWNKPYGHGLINPVNFYTHPKNPNILEVFKQIGRAEELGSGVRNVFRYGKVYGGAEPVFQEGNVFKTIIAVPVKAEKVKEEQEVKTGEGISEGLNEGINDTDNTKNDTEESKSDTENIFYRINDAVNDTVNDAVISKVRIRLAEIVKILIKTPGLKPSELSQRLNTSEITIKRDVQKIRKLIVYKGGQKDGGHYLTSTTIEKIKS